LFPGLAVAETLLSRNHEVRLLVSERVLDRAALAELIPCSDRSALQVGTVSAIGLNGSRQLMRFCYRLAKATRDCAAVCRTFQPDVVLGMGGFTAAPVVLAARWRRAPTLIHESNAVPGKANRWAGRLADHVMVGLADCAKHFGSKPVTVTGTPLRAALRAGRVPDAHARLGLQRGRLTLLVMGGSQGAHAINESMIGALTWLEDWREQIQFVHLSGARDEPFVRDGYEKNGMTAIVMGFCNEMELAYSVADAVVARSGAATLTEIAAFGLPAILLPYPHAAGDHQMHNARVFERAGAAVVISQDKLSGLHATACEHLAEAVTTLFQRKDRRAQMGNAVRSLAITDADERIASLLEQYAG